MGQYLERIVAQLDTSQVEATIARLESHLARLEGRSARGLSAQGVGGRFLSPSDPGGAQPVPGEARQAIEDRLTAVRKAIAFEQVYAENAGAIAALEAELVVLKGANLAAAKAVTTAVQADLIARAHPAGRGIEAGVGQEVAQQRVAEAARSAEVRARNLEREELAEAENVAAVRTKAQAALHEATIREERIAVVRAQIAEEAVAESQRIAAARELADLTKRAAVSISEQIASYQLQFEIATQMLRADSEILDWKVKNAVIQAQLAAVEKKKLVSALRAAGLEAEAAALAGRGSGPASSGVLGGAGKGFFRGVVNENLPTGGGGFLDQAKFFAGALAVFGLVNQLQEAVKATGELQKQFGVIEIILNQFDQGDQIAHIKQQVLDLSVYTATAAGEVAAVERQLAGVFAREVNGVPGVPDFERGAEEAESALKFAKITGESFKDIVDDFSAIAVSFAVVDDAGKLIIPTFQQIGALALNLGQQLGVPDAEILKFTSDLAPLGAALGFTVEQLAGLGAVAIQALGVGASGIAEKIGRSLVGLQDKFPQLIELFSQNESTKGLVGELGTAFGLGKIPDVLKILVGHYKELNAAQIQNLALIVGGRREAGTFYALLQRAPETLRALDQAFPKASGDVLEERFKKVTQTITFQFEQAKIAVQRFFIELLDSGLAEGLTTIAGGMGFVADELTTLVGIFSEFNDVLGGIPGQIVGIGVELYALIKVIQLASKAIALFRTVSIGSGLIGGLGAVEGATVADKLALGAYAGAGTLSGAVGIPFAGGAAGATGIGLVALGAYVTRQKIGEITKEAGKPIYENALTELQKGTSEEEIRRRAREAYGGGPSSVIADFTTFATGQKDPQDLITDAVQKDENARNVARLKALEGKPGTTGADVLGTSISNAQLASALASYPTSNFLNDLAKKQLDAVKDPALQKILDDAATASDIGVSQLGAKGDEIAGAVRTLEDPARIESIVQLQEAFDKGKTGSVAIQSLLKTQIDALTIAVDAVKASGGNLNDENNKKLVDELSNLQKQFDTNAHKAALGALDAARSLRAATGQDQSQASFQLTLSEIQRAAEELRSTETLTPEDSKSLFEQGVQALKDARQKRADAVSGALEKNRILSEPIELPPWLRRLEAEIYLSTGAGAKNVDALAAETGLDPKVIKEHLTNQFVEFGKFDLAASNMILEAKKAVLADIQEQIRILTADAIASGDPGKFSFQIANLQALADIAQGQIDDAAAASDDEGWLDLRLQVENLKLAALQKLKDDITKLGGLFAWGASLTLPSGGIDQAIADEQAKIDAILAIINGFGSGSDSGLVGSIGGSDDPGGLTAATDILNKKKAQLNLRKAQVSGDPAAVAAIDAQIAALDAEFARAHGDSTGLINAQASAVAANKARAAAIADIAKAQRELSATQSGDPLEAAQNAVQDALDAQALAEGVAAKARAAAAVIEAERGVAAAISSILDAQSQLAIAIANAAGDSIEAAEIGLADAKRHLEEVKQQTPGDKAAIDLANKAVVDAAASLIQVTISEGESAIQTDLTLRRITKGQAIAELQALYAKAQSMGASKKELDQIAIEIQNLKGSLGEDFKYNLPSVLGLPTLYEARRTDQTPGAFAGIGASNTYDNRNYSITINTASTDPQAVADAVQVVIGNPNAYSTGTKRYP